MFQTSEVHFSHLHQNRRNTPPKFEMQGKNSRKPATFSSDPRNLQVLWINRSLKYAPVRSGRLSMPATCTPGMYRCLTVGNLKALRSSQGISQIIYSVISSNCQFVYLTQGLTQFLLFLLFLQPRNMCLMSVLPVLSLFILGVKSSVSFYKSFSPSQFFLLSPYSCTSHKHRLIKTIQPRFFKFNSSPGALWSGEFCWLTPLQRKKKFFSWPSTCLFFQHRPM